MPDKKQKPRAARGAFGTADSSTGTKGKAKATARQATYEEATPPDLEAVMDIDRRYFARHPHRRYYCRRMYDAERVQYTRLGGGNFCKEPGTLDVVVVKHQSPGFRIRRPLQITGSPSDTDLIYDTELPEEACRKLFFMTASDRYQIWQLIDPEGRAP
jgi:hypothetical protein